MKLDTDIERLDLACVAFKLAVDEGWQLDRIDSGLTEYRWYLQCIRANPGKYLAPSREVDTVWHHHILDTRKYVADCQGLFGRYIHHFPYSGNLSEEDFVRQQEHFQSTNALITQLQSS